MVLNSGQKLVFPQLVYVQSLLSIELKSISLLRKTSVSGNVVTTNPTVHETLKSESIRHIYTPINKQSWQQINQRLFETLNDIKQAGSRVFAEELRDTWSHLLISEINHLMLLGESIALICRSYSPSCLVVKHTLDTGEFSTLRQALLQMNLKSIKQIIDWNDFER
jgi:hypothetical protein